MRLFLIFLGFLSVTALHSTTRTEYLKGTWELKYLKKDSRGRQLSRVIWLEFFEDNRGRIHRTHPGEFPNSPWIINSTSCDFQYRFDGRMKLSVDDGTGPVEYVLYTASAQNLVIRHKGLKMELKLQRSLDSFSSTVVSGPCDLKLEQLINGYHTETKKLSGWELMSTDSLKHVPLVRPVTLLLWRYETRPESRRLMAITGLMLSGDSSGYLSLKLQQIAEYNNSKGIYFNLGALNDNYHIRMHKDSVVAVKYMSDEGRRKKSIASTMSVAGGACAGLTLPFYLAFAASNNVNNTANASNRFGVEETITGFLMLGSGTLALSGIILRSTVQPYFPIRHPAAKPRYWKLQSSASPIIKH